MVGSMIKEAKLFHRNEIEAMEEVNKQNSAFMNVPYAMKNEFLSLHKNKNGNFNFYNLVIAHYTQDCHQDEFLFINKGRFEKIDEHTYTIGNFIYEFDEDKQLVSVDEK